MNHLDQMDGLRDGIGLRGYAQRDPLVEYQKEAYTQFERLLGSVESIVVKKLYRLNPAAQPQPRAVTLRKDEVVGGKAQKKVVKKSSPKSSGKKITRNDPCPCGSGLKYKKCGLVGAPQHKA
jgi:preprotein translocase subunit SecA